MKEFRLVSWPDVQPLSDSSAYPRVLNALSQRHMTLAQLTASTGLRRHELRAFIDRLMAQGHVVGREAPVSDALFGSLRPLGRWVRHCFSAPAGSGQGKRPRVGHGQGGRTDEA